MKYISNGTYGGFVSKNKIYTHSKQTSNKLGLRSSSSMRKSHVFFNILEYILFCIERSMLGMLRTKCHRLCENEAKKETNISK